MSSQVYTPPNPSYSPRPGRSTNSRPLADHDDHPDYPGVNAHGAEVLRVRGVSPEVARDFGIESWSANQCASYGFRGDHARDATAIPNYNILGEIDGVQIRPELPVGEQKYLWKRDHSPQIGGYPAGTPEAAECAAQLLHDLRVSVVASESNLKNGSILSHAQRDIFPLSIHGNWNWSKHGAVTPQLRWIPRYEKKHGKIVYRRKMVLVPDSNYWTKPEVARGWWEFGTAARGLGFDVRVAVVPHAPDGTSWGPDDALAAGATTVETLIDTAIPLPDIMPAAITDAIINDPDAPEVERLRAENSRLRRQVSAQARLLTTLDITDKERMVGFRLITETAAAASRGEAGADGRVRVRASVVANDFRKKPARGETWADINPDGTKPLIRRDGVKGIVTKFKAAGALPVDFEPTVRTHSTGDRYPDHDIVVDASDPIGMIVKLADYRSEKTRKPYTRQEPCPHCHEVHPRRKETTARTFCEGCGAQTGEDETITTIIPVPVANDPEATDDEREQLGAQVSAPDPAQNNGEPSADDLPVGASQKNGEGNNPPSPPPTYDSSQKNGEASGERDHQPSKAEHSAARAALPWDSVPATSDGLNLCLDCGSPTPNTYRCSSCVDEAKRRNDARWRVSA